MGLPAFELPDYEKEGNAVIHPAFMSVEEYLRLEMASDYKHEYFAYEGEAVLMAGAEPGHNMINYALNQALGPQLRRGCQGFMSDQRVETRNAAGYLYPDTVVACGPTFSERSRPRSLTNPVLIVEVMFGSTRGRDRGEKFFLYRQIASLRQYLLLDSESIHAELCTRDEQGRWLLEETADPAAILDLSSVGARLPLPEIYADVELAAAPDFE